MYVRKTVELFLMIDICSPGVKLGTLCANGETTVANIVSHTDSRGVLVANKKTRLNFG